MLFQIIIVVLAAVSLVGCATTKGPSAQDQLQSRIVDLEKKLEEKDSEIVDLQYEVKDLSNRVEAASNNASNESASVAAPVATTAQGADSIIRVNVAPEVVQTALKSAGYYTGKVDGKVGAGTKAAIVAFQKANGLTADGVLGRKTWELLKAHSK